jgi:glycosyltransferase involved in cell wall biosynthesis
MGTPAKLCFFLPSLGGGGAERVWLTFANGLAERGAEVELVTPSGPAAYARELDPRVRWVRLPASRLSLTLAPLCLHLSRAKPDALLSTMTLANLMATAAVKLSSPRTRLVLRESTSPSANYYRALDRLQPPARRLAYRFADAIIAPSQGVLTDLQASLTSSALPKLHLIENPLPIDGLIAQAEEPPAMPLGDFTTQGPLILGCGRLNSLKAFDVLIRAFAMVQAERPARLMILGEGPQRAALEELVGELGLTGKVTLPGFFANPFPAFARARVFVLSSRYEGLPNVLLQAMAFGANVVSTDCKSGPSDIIQSKAQGLLVPVGDVQAMSQAMLRQLEAPHPNQEAQRRARDFDAPRAIDKMVALLRALGTWRA